MLGKRGVLRGVGDPPLKLGQEGVLLLSELVNAPAEPILLLLATVAASLGVEPIPLLADQGELTRVALRTVLGRSRRCGGFG